MTLSHLAAVGSLMLRALPVLLLTVLVFFNSPVWLMASTVSRRRLWLALLFLFADRRGVRGFGHRSSGSAGHRRRNGAEHREARLAGTPFEAMPDPSGTQPLRRAERLNVMFVLAASQLAQIMVVAVVTALIFFILGLILLVPELLAAWTRNGSSDGTFLGMTIPVPQALIQVTMFLAALTFMYVSAKVRRRRRVPIAVPRSAESTTCG